MSVEILTSNDGRTACMVCNTSDWAFGPIFRDRGSLNADQLAEAFKNSLLHDPRYYTQSDLEAQYARFILEFDRDESQFVCECGEPSSTRFQNSKGQRFCSMSCLDLEDESA